MFYVTQDPAANAFDTVLYFGENDNDTSDGIIFGQDETNVGVVVGLNTSGVHSETKWNTTNTDTNNVHLWNASAVDKNNFNTTTNFYTDGATATGTFTGGADNSWV